MAKEDEKSIEWYRNELKTADKNVRGLQALLEEARKIVNGYLEEIAGLNSVIDNHYSNEELEAKLKECKDGRAKQADQLEAAGERVRQLEEKVELLGRRRADQA